MPVMSDESFGPGSAPSEADIDAVFVWTAIRVGRLLERMAAARLADTGHGLTQVQFGVLAYLGARPGMSQSELARAIQVRPQSAHETVTAMIDEGVLERVGPGGRGRPAALRLTDHGYALLSRTWPAVTGISATDLGLTPDDAATLNGLLHTVLHTPATRSR
ncbi:DNA-binding MarR family transcriptional regulator [Herbihabitans rhizosphaerae]|uniref:DNA-binding MarR family transcriptional regulator n=1 Tax=Herbihabitans rhizosphaerae TaxID=1872711 RepID=A0A4Q7L5W9_9PSEU|nr:MarR family winged helix-turn-helix transcriptional regulator [Herbihabitans rhizosphaerae]RZS45058.1 DNA-binding MarR family transcriptional regulator [Herbihabitans rhizosphaerae]